MTNALAANANHRTLRKPLNASSSSFSDAFVPSPTPANRPAPSKDGRSPQDEPAAGRMRNVEFDPVGVKAGKRDSWLR